LGLEKIDMELRLWLRGLILSKEDIKSLLPKKQQLKR
jgi:hypothetical protein